MKKILACVVALFLATLIYDASTQEAHSYTSGSPGGYSGSPSDGNRTCANGCHGGAAINTSNLISTDIPTDGYTPGSTYSITILANHQGRLKYGFELSANNAAGVSKGGFVNVTSATKSIAGNNVTHTSSGTSAPNGSRTWTLDWVAPAEGSGNITFYVAINATNNAGSSSGDVILSSSLTVAEKISPCTINDVPVSAALNQICEGTSGSVRVNNSQSGISYQLFDAGSNQAIGSPQNGNGSLLTFSTGNLSTTTSFKVVATKNANCSLILSSQVQIEVKPAPLPQISFGNSPSFCDGDSLLLSSTSAQSYQWNNGSTSQTQYVKQGGVYSVVAGYANNCFRTSNAVTITRHPLPNPQLNRSGLAVLCQGDSIFLETGNFNSYLWSDGRTSKGIWISSGGTFKVTVSGTGNCSATSADSLLVELSSKPSNQINTNGPLNPCPGDTLEIAAASADTYAWNTGQNTQAVQVTQSGLYFLDLSIGPCTVRSDSIEIQFVELNKPVLNFQDNILKCQGDSVELFASESYNFMQWSNGLNTDTIKVFESASIWLSASNDGRCYLNSDTLTISFGNTLKPSIELSAPPVICGDQALQLNTQVYNSYLWSNGDTTRQITADTAGYYYVWVGTAQGCQGTSDSIYIDQDTAIASKLNYTGFQNACDSLRLKVSPSNYPYIWSNALVGSEILVNADGWYWADLISAKGCRYRSDSVLVVIGQKPDININRSGNLLIATDSLQLNWYRNAQLLSGENNDTLNVMGLEGLYYCIQLDERGICSDTSNSIQISFTAIDENLDLDPLSLYPNPVKNRFQILNQSQAIDWQLSDISGKIILSGLKQPNEWISVERLSGGAYLLILSPGSTKRTILPLTIEK